MILYNGQTLTPRKRYAGTVTGTPSVQLYVNGSASGSALNGTADGAEWLFSVALSGLAIGDFVELRDTATVDGAVVTDTLVQGSVVAVLNSPGTGAFTASFAVKDDAGTPNNLTGVQVRLVDGATVLAAVSESGVATVKPGPGTYTVSATKAGYELDLTDGSGAGWSLVGDQLTITGDASGIPLTMAVRAIAASLAGKATGYIDPVEDELGKPEVGAEFTVEITQAPSAAGYAGETKPRTAESVAVGSSARVEFVGLVHGGTYKITRGSGKPYEFVVPEVASFAINSLIGQEIE